MESGSRPCDLAYINLLYNYIIYMYINLHPFAPICYIYQSVLSVVVVVVSATDISRPQKQLTARKSLLCCHFTSKKRHLLRLENCFIVRRYAHVNVQCKKYSTVRMKLLHTCSTLNYTLNLIEPCWKT